jgi:hypothetical protein
MRNGIYRTTLPALLLGCLAQSAVADGYRTREVIAGGPFHGVHGLAFGPDGALYAAGAKLVER